MRARQDGWSPGRLLSWLAFVAGLLAGEMGLGALALMAAWEVFASRDATRRRILALLPFALIQAVLLGIVQGVEDESLVLRRNSDHVFPI